MRVMRPYDTRDNHLEAQRGATWVSFSQESGCGISAFLHEKSYPRVGFSPFFLRASEVPTIVARCFRMHFWQRERMALRHWTGTISGEVGLFCWRSACVTRRAVNASDQLGKIGGKGRRAERTTTVALYKLSNSLLQTL